MVPEFLIEKDLPAADEAKLKTIYQLGESESLPRRLLDVYWTGKVILDRTGCGVRDDVFLTMICMLAGGVPMPPPPTFGRRARDGEIARGTPVLINWRGEPILGTFVGVAYEGIVVDLNGDERIVKDELVGDASAVGRGLEAAPPDGVPSYQAQNGVETCTGPPAVELDGDLYEEAEEDEEVPA